MKLLRWLLVLAGLFVLLHCWQQQTFEVRRDCSQCHGRGKITLPYIPEDPEPPRVDCYACGPMSRARLQWWIWNLRQEWPDSQFAAWAGLSGIVLAGLIYGLRQVPDRGMNP